MGGKTDTQTDLIEKIIQDTGISKPTARKAIELAVSQGKIKEQPGKGKALMYETIPK